MKRILSTAAALVSIGTTTLAFAGGFEYPGNGTEAMGRGAAFTAKADDGTAFDYNIAGFAQQRGTRVLFDSNLIWNSLSFKRAGVYPEPSTGMNAQDYGGQPYPTIHNSAGAGYVPFVAVSTDFGIFDRWTFAIGLFAPNSVSSRTYPTTVTVNGDKNTPAPQRYDVTTINPLIAFPSLAAAFRATHWLDIGVAVHLVYANLDLSNASLVYLSPLTCRGDLEYSGCDSVTTLKTSAITGSASLGLMFHPARGLDIGANVRPQIDIQTHGTATGTSPTALPTPLTPSNASFHLRLPTELKAGIRYAWKGADKFEHGDIELDGDYENWKNAEGNGDQVHIDALGPFRNVSPTITHHYQDTYSARFGGAYNIKLPQRGKFTLRGGVFFDSAATKYKDTRVDFDTMAKYGVTSGLGFTMRGISIDVAYAYIYEPDRNVQNGDIQSINGVSTKDPTLTSDGPTPVINNGLYKAHNNMVSVGLKIAWEDLLNRHKRVIHWE